MNKDQRIEKVNSQRDDAIFMVENETGFYWANSDRGYNSDIRFSRIFTKDEIRNMLENGSFMNKKIVCYQPDAII